MSRHQFCKKCRRSFIDPNSRSGENFCPECMYEMRYASSGGECPELRQELAAAEAALVAKDARIAELEALLRGALPLAENGATRTESGHTCGPENNCDCTCMAAAYDSALLLKIRTALTKKEGVAKLAEKLGPPNAS